MDEYNGWYTEKDRSIRYYASYSIDGYGDGKNGTSEGNGYSEEIECFKK